MWGLWKVMGLLARMGLRRSYETWRLRIASASVVVSDLGSTCVVRGGRVSRCRKGRGVLSIHNGHAEVRDVEITDCKMGALFCYAATLLHSGCVVSGCGEESLGEGDRQRWM